MIRATAADLTPILNTFPIDVIKIIEEFNAQRRLPVWTLSRGVRYEPENTSIMSILGVEGNHSDWSWGVLGIVIDIRWFKSALCTCSNNPCSCVCKRRQLINICGVLGLDHSVYDNFAEENDCQESESDFTALMFAGFEENDGMGFVGPQLCGKCIDCGERDDDDDEGDY